MHSEILSSRPDGPFSDAGFKIGDDGLDVPSYRTLAGFAIGEGCEEGVAIESLEPGTTVTIQTINTKYRLTVLDEGTGKVLVEGGQRFREATPAVLQGSSAGGHLLKTGWIGVGLHVELRVGSRLVITSRVHSITTDPPVAHYDDSWSETTLQH